MKFLQITLCVCLALITASTALELSHLDAEDGIEESRAMKDFPSLASTNLGEEASDIMDYRTNESIGRIFTDWSQNGTYGITIGSNYVNLIAGGGLLVLSLIGIGLLIAAIGSGVAFFYADEPYYKYENADYDSAYADFSAYAGKTDDMLKPVLQALGKVNYRYRMEKEKAEPEIYRRQRSSKHR